MARVSTTQKQQRQGPPPSVAADASLVRTSFILDPIAAPSPHLVNLSIERPLTSDNLGNLLGTAAFLDALAKLVHKKDGALLRHIPSPLCVGVSMVRWSPRTYGGVKLSIEDPFPRFAVVAESVMIREGRFRALLPDATCPPAPFETEYVKPEAHASADLGLVLSRLTSLDVTMQAIQSNLAVLAANMRDGVQPRSGGDDGDDDDDEDSSSVSSIFDVERPPPPSRSPSPPRLPALKRARSKMDLVAVEEPETEEMAPAAPVPSSTRRSNKRARRH